MIAPKIQLGEKHFNPTVGPGTSRHRGQRTGRLPGQGATEEGGDRAEPSYLREASLSHLTLEVTETWSSATNTWIREHSGRRRRYRPPKGKKMRKALAKERKGRAGRFYQLLSGHAATGEHLMRVNQAESDKCFWCGSGEWQTRFHLFPRCRR